MTSFALRFQVLLVLTVCLGACSCGSGDTKKGSANNGGNDASVGGANNGGNDASVGGANDGDAATGGSGGSGDAGEPMTATLFINDTANGVVYRYNVTPSTDPVLTATIPAAPSASGMAVSSTGELFVAEYTSPISILRFQNILGTPTANGTIANPDGQFIQNMAFVDSELWALSSAYQACNTNPSNIVRVAFDATGVAAAAGTLTTGLNGANRGMLWDPTARILYVTQCEAQRAIQRFHVSADHTLTALTPVTGDPLDNPHGMVMTSWRELIVANAGLASAPGRSLLRFTVDEQGNLTANGTIDSDDLDLPIGVAIAPWGELFAVNNGDAVISRFTFDSSHVATAHGTFQMNAPTQVQSLGVGWPIFVPGASTMPGDGGAN